MNDLFNVLFKDDTLGFGSMDSKKLNDAIDASNKRNKTGSQSLYDGIDLFLFKNSPHTTIHPLPRCNPLKSISV